MRIPLGLCAVLVSSTLLACGDSDDGGADGPRESRPDGERDEAGTTAEGGRGAAGRRGGEAADGGGAAGRRGVAGGAGRGGHSVDGGIAPQDGRGESGDDGGSDEADAGGDSQAAPERPSGEFLALTYNVAGLPEGLSSSMPQLYMPIIGPLLNGYDLVYLQESWQTPDPNPVAPLRVYHEILVAASEHPYKTPAADQPLGGDPSRPSALLSDGINMFSQFPLGETRRVAWATCVDTASDCLAFKGFSMTPSSFSDGTPVHFYDLHMEAGESPEDDVARDGGIDQMLAFIAENSADTALIMAGDFNLETDSEPAASQYRRLLDSAGLTDACEALACAVPGNIDKLAFRSSARLEIRAESWERESDVFVTSEGQPLSDHEPVAVRLHWAELAAE